MPERTMLPLEELPDDGKTLLYLGEAALFFATDAKGFKKHLGRRVIVDGQEEILFPGVQRKDEDDEYSLLVVPVSDIRRAREVLENPTVTWQNNANFES